MFNPSIFRQAPLEKMTSPDDLDEMLQVNTLKMWMVLAALFFVLAGFAIWLFQGSITQRVNGTGIIVGYGLARQVIMPQSGQVDSIFCLSGDTIPEGIRLFGFKNLENQVYQVVKAPDTIIIAGIHLQESDFASLGDKVLEYIGLSSSCRNKPEVRFLLDEQSLTLVQPGMQVTVYPGSVKGIQGSGVLTGAVANVSGVPISAAELRNYPVTNNDAEAESGGRLFEVRALLNPDSRLSPEIHSRLLAALNNQRCEVVVEVARQSPFSWLVSVSR